MGLLSINNGSIAPLIMDPFIAVFEAYAVAMIPVKFGQARRIMAALETTPGPTEYVSCPIPEARQDMPGLQ